YYETLLHTTGAGFKVFRTGKEFVEFIKTPGSEFDMVIMDFLVPLVNGIDCIRTLRKEHKNVPAVMITAYSSEQTRSEAFIAGCTEFILKPVYPDKVYNLLEKYLLQEVNSYHNHMA
ncbi:MAG: response regulator, partial [Bacteroidales bacterium]|nr:response regulator [Bacteroidales bacterium]